MSYCILCNGRGYLYTQPYGVKQTCFSCRGSGKHYDLGSLMHAPMICYECRESYKQCTCVKWDKFKEDIHL